MSRFYALELFAPGVEDLSVKVPPLPPLVTKHIYYNTTPTKVWTSHPNGIYDPGAQNIEFDVLIYALAMGSAPSFLITVEGLSFEDVKQYNNFHNYGIKLYAGMLPGLPLADNQPTPGLIAQGYVQQGIGNWVGEQMTVTFVCYWGIFSPDQPGPIVFHWSPGQSLASALHQCIAQAYKGYKLSINISGNPATSRVVAHISSTLGSFAFWLQQYTKTATYPGVSIYHNNDGSIVVTDKNVTNANITTLRFTDLIGQPTWAGGENEALALDVVTALRSDISAGTMLKMPNVDVDMPGLVFELPTLTNASVNYKLAFKGEFMVASARYVGNFRSSNATEWASVFRCYGQ